MPNWMLAPGISMRIGPGGGANGTYGSADVAALAVSTAGGAPAARKIPAGAGGLTAPDPPDASQAPPGIEGPPVPADPEIPVSPAAPVGFVSPPLPVVPASPLVPLVPAAPLELSPPVPV